MNCSLPGFPIFHYFPEFAQTVHWVSKVIQPSCPLLSPSPPALNLSQNQVRVFSSESALHIRWPKYWSFNFSISHSNEYSVLISFRLTGLISLQSKGLSRVFFSTTIWKLQFFCHQLSFWSNFTSVHDHWINYSFKCMNFVSKGISLHPNTMSRFVIALLPRGKVL